MNDTEDNQDLDQMARTQAALAAQARAREVAAGIAVRLALRQSGWTPGS